MSSKLPKSDRVTLLKADALTGASAFFIRGIVLCAFVALLLLQGCLVTAKRGDQMQASITANTTMMERNREEVKALDQKVKSAKDDIDLLDKRFKEYLDISREKAAGTSVTLDQFKLEIQRLQGLIEEVRYELSLTKRDQEQRLSAMEHKLDLWMQQNKGKGRDVAQDDTPPEPVKAGAPSQTPPQESPDAVPADMKTHFRKGRALIEDNDHVPGRALMTAFIKKYGDDRLCDDAQYWIGKSYFMERRFNEAIGAFQKVLDSYPKGDMGMDATFMLGECFAGLELLSDAKVFFLQVKQHGGKDLQKKAEKRLKEIK